jgi:dimethylaniline monooxygenase (N-oxide forming)
VNRANRVCVIGAGTSGLAAVDALARAGHAVTCYEAGSGVGGMWRYENDNGMSAAYESLHANTSRRRMEYPGFSMPDTAAEYLHHTELLAYLESYARAQDLTRHIEFGARVERVRRLEQQWEVTTADREPARFDWLVVASGHYWEKAIPELPGRFSGTVIHTCDYRAPDRFAGQRVVVVGGAQSALDIAAEISTPASHTVLACDQVHHLVPRHTLGRPTDDFDSPLSLLVPVSFVRLTFEAILRVTGATPNRDGLPPARHRLLETRWPIVVSPAVEAALDARAFATRPHVRALSGDQVVFGDGSVERADAIVFATGYRIGFPFLEARLGRGDGWEFPLYRRILSPYASKLAFIGVIEPGPGLFEIVARQSRWLAEAIAGRMPTPDENAMWRAIDAGGEPRSHRQFGATGQHTIFCNRHAYLRLLARDLRAGGRRGVRAGSARTGDATAAVDGARPTARPLPGRRLPAAVPSARFQSRLLRPVAQGVARETVSGTLEDLARHRTTLVVTFRRDGTPVATPVWAAIADGSAYVRAERGSGKVRRLRHDSRVLLAPCTTRGRQLGPPLAASGRVLAAGEEQIAEQALAERYGLTRAAFERTMDAMHVDMCYLELTPAANGRAG